jgi:hypothetical protein
MGLVGRQFYSREAVIYRYISVPTAVLYQYNIAPRQYYSGGINIPLHRGPIYIGAVEIHSARNCRPCQREMSPL